MVCAEKSNTISKKFYLKKKKIKTHDQPYFCCMRVVNWLLSAMAVKTRRLVAVHHKACDKGHMSKFTAFNTPYKNG